MGKFRAQARDDELQSLMKLKVFQFIHKSSLSHDDRRKALIAIFLLVDKYYPNGEFEKSKGRMVADGSRQLEGTYEQTNAQTINQITAAFSKAVRYKLIKTKGLRCANCILTHTDETTSDFAHE